MTYFSLIRVFKIHKHKVLNTADRFGNYHYIPMLTRQVKATKGQYGTPVLYTFNIVLFVCFVFIGEKVKLL